MEAHTLALDARYTRTRTAVLFGAVGWLADRLALHVPRLEAALGWGLVVLCSLWIAGLFLRGRDPPRHPPHHAKGRHRGAFPAARSMTRQVT